MGTVAANDFGAGPEASLGFNQYKEPSCKTEQFSSAYCQVQVLLVM
jgi:hypothetical protein